MTRIRIALTENQKEAIRTAAGAKVLVEGMNKENSMQKVEIENIRINLADLQDRYELSQASYNKTNLKFHILSTKMDVFIIIEILKILVSALLAYGFYLIGTQNLNGWYCIVASPILYILLLIWQKKHVYLEDNE